MRFLDVLDQRVKSGIIPPKIGFLMQKFYQSYADAMLKIGIAKIADEKFIQYLDFVQSQLITPYQFEPFHSSLHSPIDFYTFGLDLFRPLIDFSNSKIYKEHNLTKIESYLKQGDNVILLANHQTEPDPQIISLLLEKSHSELAKEMIFVAGHRVTTDPVAVPLSLGRNLLCIYSKRHVAHPPEKREEKLLHNQRTMGKMSQLLAEGGKCIYVAPSGGRDRRSVDGNIEVAPFDAQSIEMFYLMAKHSGHPTHFFPLALSTYDIMPPPKSVEKELGELREVQFAPTYLSFADEVDMDNFPGSQGLDKKQKRQIRAEYIWNIVKEDYLNF